MSGLQVELNRKITNINVALKKELCSRDDLELINQELCFINSNRQEIIKPYFQQYQDYFINTLANMVHKYLMRYSQQNSVHGRSMRSKKKEIDEYNDAKSLFPNIYHNVSRISSHIYINAGGRYI